MTLDLVAIGHRSHQAHVGGTFAPRSAYDVWPDGQHYRPTRGCQERFMLGS